MVLAREALEHPIDGRLALDARDLVVARLAPEEAQNRQQKGNAPAVVEMLQKGTVGQNKTKQNKSGVLRGRWTKAKL